MSEPIAPFFHLTLTCRTGSFGESAASEANEVKNILHRAAQVIGSSVPIDWPEQRQLKCSAGPVVGYFEFSEAAIKGPGVGFDRTHFSRPSPFELANAPRRIAS